MTAHVLPHLLSIPKSITRRQAKRRDQNQQQYLESSADVWAEDHRLGTPGWQLPPRSPSFLTMPLVQYDRSDDPTCFEAERSLVVGRHAAFRYAMLGALARRMTWRRGSGLDGDKVGMRRE